MWTDCSLGERDGDTWPSPEWRRVLENGVRLPEGQEVIVRALAPQDLRAHGIMDIPPISVGTVLRPLTEDDDVLGEMLEGRR